MRRDVFQAIADPTRRAIIQMIADKPLNIHSVSENFGVSRTAIYKHIKILTECGLIHVQQQGRERYCEARLDKLGEVSAWADMYRKQWADKLSDLEVLVRDSNLIRETNLIKDSNLIRDTDPETHS